MKIGTSNQTEVSIIEEVTAGVTPATPELQIMRMTGESIQANLSTTVSDEIRSDRSTSDLIPTDQSNSGDLNFEFSGGTYDKLLKALLFSNDDWTVLNYTGDGISATATGFTDSDDGFVTAGVEVGQFFKVSGFTNPNNNVLYKAVSVVAGEIVTSPAPAATQAAGADITLTGSTITNGVKDYSFTVVKKFKDLTTPSYQISRGMRVGSMSLQLSVGAIVSGSFTFMGTTSEVTTTEIAGSTYLPASTTALMNCVSDVTEIKMKNDSISESFYFSDLSMSYDNALRDLKAIGNLGSIDVRAGTIVAGATVNPYFQSIQILNTFINNEALELFFALRGADGWMYVFSYPKSKFASQNVGAGSKDQDLIINGELTAIIDPNSLSTIRIDRFAP
jgi:hypothetical protein